MRILFLDDDQLRLKKAKKYYSFNDNICDLVQTAEESIKLLSENGRYDLVSLDHDLGGQVYCPSDNNSGYAVAKYIANMSDDKKPKMVVVHSFNPVGADNMLAVLEGKVNTRRQPFNL